MNRMGGGTRIPSTEPRLNGERCGTRNKGMGNIKVSGYNGVHWGLRVEIYRAPKQPWELGFRKSAVASVLYSQREGEQSVAQRLIVPYS